jgi:hypothetical protein
MSFFDYSVPPLRRKQEILDTNDLDGLIKVNWQIGKFQFYSSFYTRVDQAFILWGLLLVPMFITAQFTALSWSLQAQLWSILSTFGTVMTVILTSKWVQRRQVTWILYCWVVLMVLGIGLTDLAVFLGWVDVLLNLCPLWLGLSTFGYLCTGLAVRSRTLLVAGILHFLCIFLLPYFGGWHYLITGMLMTLCLLLLAEFEWDHR